MLKYAFLDSNFELLGNVILNKKPHLNNQGLFKFPSKDHKTYIQKLFKDAFESNKNQKLDYTLRCGNLKSTNFLVNILFKKRFLREEEGKIDQISHLFFFCLNEKNA